MNMFTWSRVRSPLVMIIAGAVAGWSLPLHAQDTPEEPGESLEATGGLMEVIVTARKREESLQDAPVAITAITADDIDRHDISSLEKLAAFSPQLVIGRGSSGSGAQITMRGVGGQATSIAIEQSTAVVVDGVYFGQGHFLNEALFDLQGMEVLKGPQALFFGKNATAGVISIRTAEPTDTFESMLRTGYEFESENLFGEAVISGPLAENLNARLAVRMANMFGGYFENHAQPTPIDFVDLVTGAVTTRMQNPSQGNLPGTSEKTARLTLQWEPTEDLTATLRVSGTQSKDETNAWHQVLYGCLSGFSQLNPAVRCGKNFNVHVINAPEGITLSVPFMRKDGSPYNEYKSVSVTADFDYQWTDNVALTSVFNYNKHRNTWGLPMNVESPIAHISATQDTEFWAASNETRLQTSFAGRLNAMVGVFLQTSKRTHFQAGSIANLQDSSLPFDLQFLSYSKPSETEGDTISGFGQVTWQALDNVEIAAGVRYSKEKKDSFLVQDHVMPVLQPLFPEGQMILGDQTFDDWSPEVTVSWRATEDVTLYGAYKTAYKSGGFSNSALVAAASTADKIMFDPETVEGFEVGLRSTLFNNQLRLNATAYRYEYEDLQVDFLNAATYEYITTNAGSSLVKGVELEALYAPLGLPNLTVNGTLNYNESRYTEFIAPCYSGQSIAAGCNTLFFGAPGQSLKGFPTAMAPEWTASLGANYEWSMGQNFTLGTNVFARYSDGYLAGSYGAPLSA